MNSGARARISVEAGLTPVVSIDGEIDVSNVEQVGEDLANTIQSRAPKVIIDLTATSYLDSSGIRMLFTVANRLRMRRAEVCLVAPRTGVVRRLLDLTEVGSLIPIVEHPDDAEAPSEQ